MHERNIKMDYNPNFDSVIRRKRVCAYVRVSSSRDEAFHSLSAQTSYYQKLISEHPDWEYAGVYSDRGISGTKEARPGFQEMLEACRAGQIDIVLAKSISRFARNTEILLETVRELRSLGVSIRFEEEHIDTLGEKGELMLSILAARSQEEARSASENQKWRIKKCYEKGIPVTGNALGYRMVDRQFLIDEEEEQIVLRIFSMYLSGMGTTAIAKQLTKEGCKTPGGKAQWTPWTVRRILENEKYQGDLRLQKTYREDYLSKRTVTNTGEKPFYYVQDAHDAIIDRDTFARTQEEIKRRADQFCYSKASTNFPFTGLVRCGRCGAAFIRKHTSSDPQNIKANWLCHNFIHYGKDRCDARLIPESILTQKTCEALDIEQFDEAVLKDRVEKIIVPEQYKLVFVFKDGSERQVEWRHRSRRESWTPEMREAARQKTLARNKAKKEKGGN